MRLLTTWLRGLMAVLVLLPISATAYEEVDDLVDIFAIDGRLIALVDGRRNFSEDFRPGEEILWQGAKGEVGAFLTSDRLLAVSVKSGRWNVQRLKINEKRHTPEMLQGSHLIVMLTAERMVAFGTDTGGFFQTRMPIGEAVIDRAARGRVAAVVTAKRAFGFSSYRRGAAEIRFRLQETPLSLQSTYTTVTLRTSQRLIALEAGDAVWREFDLK